MKTQTLLVVISIGLVPELRAQTILNAGFEDDVVSAGQFFRPTTGPWAFNNDACVVRPYAPNSSTGPLNTWSATFAPMQGQQYASTYAGGDLIRQGLFFGTAGDYRISVFAASPGGTLTIPGAGTSTMVDGEFNFVLGNATIGSLNTVVRDVGWAEYSALFTIPSPGTYDLGVRSTKLAAYFINYDAFSIQAVPEPGLIPFGLAFAAAAFGRPLLRRRGRPLPGPCLSQGSTRMR